MPVKIKKYGIGTLLCLLLLVQWALFAIPGGNGGFRAQGPPLPRPDSLIRDTAGAVRIDSAASRYLGLPVTDSVHVVGEDSVPSGTAPVVLIDSVALDSLGNPLTDSTRLVLADTVKKNTSFLEDIITGKNTDSLVYDVKNGMVKIYTEGDIQYQDMNLKADYIEMSMDDKVIYAYGIPDSTGTPTRPVFTEKGTEYTMDTITYNINTEKAKIKGVLTQEGEGILRGGIVKKMPDNTINIAHGKYSTCDADHPHFYLAMTRAKAYPGKKVVWGPSYLVMEDVPIYFLGLPFGFFPLSKARSSGFIMPKVGEQSLKGFFLRDGGYYYVPNDYIDLRLLAGIYTLGSWEVSAASRYKKRYKYNGGFNINYAKEYFGDRGSLDFGNMNNFRVQWTHSQDPKFRPNSSFAASVNFSTSNYNKYSSNNLNDYVSNQTNSSISYSKNWAGTPFSFSTNISHSQSNRDSTVSISFPNFTFNVAQIYPFRRREGVGKQRWYEKITLKYNTTFANSVTAKESDLFKKETLKKMRTGMNHTIPVSTSISLFNYINFSPSANYQERWYFNKIRKEWNPDENRVETVDTTYGFYRVYNYSFSASMNTRIYGMYQFKKGAAVQAIRHVMTPTVGFSYTPDFGQGKYGYYKPIQTDSTGRVGYYSPYENGIYGVPGRGRSASMSFSLNNTLEMKVRSKNDSTGVKKVSVIDNLGFSGSYNFLADSLNLSLITVNLRSTLIKNFGINLTATFDPYQVDERGRRINKFLIRQGKLARLTNIGTSFGYSFSLGKGAPNAMNTGNAPYLPGYDPFDPNNPLGELNNEEQPEVTPAVRRQLMTSQYYDFNVPFNFGFNYSISYNNNGIRKQITQTLGFNVSTNLTPKWGITFNGGYDFEAKKLTPGQFNLTRDLHCWQMTFSWIPIGFMKSWSFSIHVKSGMLQDLKYDKSSSFYDNFYDK